MKNFHKQTIADAMEVPGTSVVVFKPFEGPRDPELKKEWCLVDGLGRELIVLYIDARTGHFLASERLSTSKCINPLEYNKNGKFVGFSSKYNIVGKKRI